MRLRLLLPAFLVLGVLVAVGGMARGDFWSEAERRIERHRMGDLRVEVTDPNGRAVPGARVQVRMTRHAFGWGTAVNERFFTRDPAHGASAGPQPNALSYEQNHARYVAVLEKGYLDPAMGRSRPLFNRATIENGMKWINWERSADRRDRTIATFDALAGYGLEIRGHTMIWQISRAGWGLPPRIHGELFNADGRYAPRHADDDNSPAALAWRQGLREAALEHIRAIGGQGFAGGAKPVDWDVLNEHRAHNWLARAIDSRDPMAVAAEWFHAARAAAPQAMLFVNDYDILNNAPRNPVIREQYLNQIQTLLERGAPVDGIGFQGHFFGAAQRRAGQVLYDILEEFAATGLRLQVTEFDMARSGWTEQMKADFLREFLITVFSHPSIDAFTMWGFWDGRQWEGAGTLYDLEWNLKPSGQVYVDLVLNQWWTDLDGATDEGGHFHGRGFLGRHDVIVTVDGRRTVQSVELGRGQNQWRVVVK